MYGGRLVGSCLCALPMQYERWNAESDSDTDRTGFFWLQTIQECGDDFNCFVDYYCEIEVDVFFFSFFFCCWQHRIIQGSKPLLLLNKYWEEFITNLCNKRSAIPTWLEVNLTPLVFARGSRVPAQTQRLLLEARECPPKAAALWWGPADMCEEGASLCYWVAVECEEAAGGRVGGAHG